MKKALEMNLHQHCKGYTLAINPGSSASSSHYHHHDKQANSMVTPQQLRFQQPLPIKINLSLSRSMAGLFNTGNNSRNDSTNGGGDDELLAAIKDFVKVAFHVQTQLESVDEGRLGMAPRPTSSPHDATTTTTTTSTTSNMSHVGFLANPPSILTKFISLTTVLVHPKKNRRRKKESLLSATMTGACTIPSRLLPSRGRSATRRTTTAAARTRTRSKSSKDERIQKSFTSSRTQRRRNSTSTRDILSQFSSPEEARVFELYARLKSKRKALKKHKTTQKDSARSTKTVVATDGPPPAIVPMGRPLERMTSLPIIVPAGKQTPKATTITTNGTSLLPPEPPSLLFSDWNKTPVISNKGRIIIDIGSKN
jgi:hypothetical protein